MELTGAAAVVDSLREMRGFCRVPGARDEGDRHPVFLWMGHHIQGFAAHGQPTLRATPLGAEKASAKEPLQMTPQSLGIIDGVFTTSRRPIPG